MDDDQATLVIFHNFKGHIAHAVNSILEQYDILITLFPPSTTGHVQPMDLTVNKPAKGFSKQSLEDGKQSKSFQQLDGHSLDDLDGLY